MYLAFRADLNSQVRPLRNFEVRGESTTHQDYIPYSIAQRKTISVHHSNLFLDPDSLFDSGESCTDGLAGWHSGSDGMCISVLSTAHPNYAFVLISNRDEFVHRPTLRADWWDPPNQQVLGGRDLQRQERGTWLGITRQGRIAILTNYREEGVNENGQKSRGAMVNSYLTIPPESNESEDQFVERLLNDVGIHDVGGFTLLFGKLQRSKGTSSTTATSRLKMYADHLSADSPATKTFPGLAVISNRTDSSQSLPRIATDSGETHGLSNSHYGDNSWPKVVNGEQKLKQAIADDIVHDHNQNDFIDNLLAILCDDNIPKRQPDESWDAYVRHMRNSIMIPAMKGKAAQGNPSTQPPKSDWALSPGDSQLTPGVGAYGTTKQSVILVDNHGAVAFVERTLYDDSGVPLPDHERDRRIDFKIDGW